MNISIVILINFVATSTNSLQLYEDTQANFTGIFQVVFL